MPEELSSETPVETTPEMQSLIHNRYQENQDRLLRERMAKHG